MAIPRTRRPLGAEQSLLVALPAPSVESNQQPKPAAHSIAAFIAADDQASFRPNKG